MSRPYLYVVKGINSDSNTIPFAEKLADHEAILREYEMTFTTRNLSPSTRKQALSFLRKWFESYAVVDVTHPQGERHLLIWEAMEPIKGRRRVRQYSFGLAAQELSPSTRRSYLGYLRQLFEYVLDEPYLLSDPTQSLAAKYGPMEQPVSKYEYQRHVVDDETEAFALTGDDLLNFYNYVRSVYLPRQEYSLTSMRNYAMIVLAGESGLRADEIRRLDALGPHRDLFYKEEMIQTRFGKGTKGSGKRIRKTLFTKVAQDALRAYEERVRPAFRNATVNPALFLSQMGARISYREMWRDLNIIVKEARESGLDLPPKFSWHALRASFATNYVEQHGNRKAVLLELMDYLGHISFATLHRYLKHSRAYNDRAVDDFHNLLIPGVSESKEDS
jgi:site-specific recombinase XerD